MRTARIAAFISLALVAGLVTAVPASADSLDINKFAVSPAKVDGSGGRVTITAKTDNAKSCRLSASIDIAGLPVTVNCSDGSIRRHYDIPANGRNTKRKIEFTLKASNGSLIARAHVTVKQEPATPKIASIGSSTNEANPDGSTDVTVTARVFHAKKCKLRSTPDTPDLPVTVSCTSGSFDQTFTVPRNTTANERTFTITLAVRNYAGAKDTRTVTVTQAGAPPAIRHMTASPASVPATGGNVTVTADVVRAARCTFTTSPDVGTSSTPESCTSGRFSRTITIPPNTSMSQQSYDLTLTARGPGGTATTTLTITQAALAPSADGSAGPSAVPAAAPSITNLATNPASITYAGGNVTVTANVANASTCTFTTTPDLGSSTAPVNCSGGTFSRTVTIPANMTGTAQQYSLKLKATGSGGTATGTITLTVPPAPPGITDYSSTPATVKAAGGSITVNATVTRANTCALSSTPDLGISTTPVSCTSGSFTRAVTVPANNTTATKTYDITLDVSGPGGTASATLSIAQAPMAPRIANLAANPDTLTAAATSVKITAAVLRASSCSFTSSPSLGGSTAQFACAGAPYHFSRVVNVPANNTGSARSYVLTLNATGAGGTATGTLTLNQPAAGGTLAISNVAVSPNQVRYVGGDFTVTADVTGASTCTFTSNPDTLGLSSSPFACSGSPYQFSQVVTLPSNTTATTKTYVLTLTANGSGGRSVSGTVTLRVPPAPPRVTNYRAAPPTVTAAGRTLTFTANVVRASTCTFSSDPATLGVNTNPVDCTGGTFSRQVTIPANNTGSSRSYTFTLDADGGGGSATTSLTITQPSS